MWKQTVLQHFVYPFQIQIKGWGSWAVVKSANDRDTEIPLEMHRMYQYTSQSSSRRVWHVARRWGVPGEAHPRVSSQRKRWSVICLPKEHSLYLKNSGSTTIAPPLVFMHIALLFSFRESSHKCWGTTIENYQHLRLTNGALVSSHFHLNPGTTRHLWFWSLWPLPQTIAMVFSLSSLILLKQCFNFAFPEALLISLPCVKDPIDFPSTTQWGPTP